MKIRDNFPELALIRFPVRILPGLVLASSMAVTYSLWHDSQREAKYVQQVEFDAQIREIHALITQRLAAYEQMLRGAAGLFAASTAVSREEFRAYVASLKLREHYPGIQGIGFSLVVLPKDKARHIETLRKQGFSGYAIRPEGGREIYTSIIYLEPFADRNLRAFGYDMLSESIRRAAMERARDTGDIAISGKVKLVQETDRDVQAGFLMYLPVYRNGVPHDTPDQRRVNLLGWVYDPFRMNDLMLGIFGRHTEQLDIEIYDGDRMSPENLMYDSSRHRYLGYRHESAYESVQTISIGGNRWTIAIYSLPAFEVQLGHEKPRIIAFTGIALSLAFCMMTWSLTRGRAHAVRLAEVMNRELIKSEAAFRTLFEQSPAGVVSIDAPSGRIQRANLKMAHMLGYGIEELERMTMFDLTHPDDASESRENLRQLAAGEIDQFHLEKRCVRKDGRPFWTDTIVTMIRGPVNEAGYAMALITDIDERKHTEEELLLASSVYQASGEAIMVTDAANLIVAVNPAFTRVTGYTLPEVAGWNPKLLSSGRQDASFYRTMWQALAIAGYWQGEIWNRRKNGDMFAAWMTINVIPDKDGEVYRYVALLGDITEKKRSDETIWEHANYDPLTHLPNRRLFRDRLQQEIKKTQRAGLSLALLFIDLDHFKEINDTLGHDIGDLLLMDAAQRIRGCVRDSDTVARLGGDEFTVILSQLTDVAHVEQVAQAIVRTLGKPFKLGQEVVYVTASIGITMYPADAVEVEDLLKNADQAMYVAKNLGRNGFSYFTASMQEAARERLRLINDLRNALAAGQFSVYFQPIVDLKTGSIVKAEALLRWRHPVRGMVSPDQFIPLAEEVGLIHDIGNWIFRESARWARHWHEQRKTIQISVNRSPVQFIAGQCFTDWENYLKEIGLPGECLGIEITEGLLLRDRPEIVKELEKFHDLGMRVAIDDFGTGYSALSYLKRFAIDYLKIDRSFVQDLDSNPDALALSEAIIVMAHKLGLQVVAEGVETVKQRGMLIAAGCDYGQGHLFAPPIPAEEFDALLGRSADRDSRDGRPVKIHAGF